MKIAFFLISFLASSFSYAQQCDNLSGSYKLESEYPDNEPIVLVIEQNKCDSVSLKYSDPAVSTENFKLNGMKVKHAEFPEIGLTIFATPYVKGRDIVIDIENVWQDGQKDKFKRRLHLEFSSKTLLLDQRGNFRDDGVFVPSTQTVYQKEL